MKQAALLQHIDVMIRKANRLLISIMDHLPHIIPHILNCNLGIFVCVVCACVVSYLHVSFQYLCTFASLCSFVSPCCVSQCFGCLVQADSRRRLGSAAAAWERTAGCLIYWDTLYNMPHCFAQGYCSSCHITVDHSRRRHERPDSRDGRCGQKYNHSIFFSYWLILICCVQALREERNAVALEGVASAGCQQQQQPYLIFWEI